MRGIVGTLLPHCIIDQEIQSEDPALQQVWPHLPGPGGFQACGWSAARRKGASPQAPDSRGRCDPAESCLFGRRDKKLKFHLVTTRPPATAVPGPLLVSGHCCHR